MRRFGRGSIHPREIDSIITLREPRRISAQQTVHYKRGLYVLEDAVDNRRLRRTVALVSEDADGTVTIRGVNGRVVPYRLFRTNQAQLVPGVVVEHQRLDAVFEWIAAQQRERDAAGLANPELTLHEKHRIRAASPSA